MPHVSKFVLSSLVGLVLCLTAATVAQADPLVLSVSNPIQVGAPGSTLTFIGSVFNSGATNGLADTITGGTVTLFPTIPPGAPALSIDGTAFGTNFSGQTVTSGSTLGPLAIFSVTISPLAAPGTVYPMSLTFNYTNSQGVQFVTNPVALSVTVTSPVPEPTTLLLFGSGLSALAGIVSRRRMRGCD